MTLNMTHSFDALILGGGAAGLMCAIEAGKRGRRVAVLERADRLGKKILISGGGRCNFTNLHCQPENFLSSNPHFAKSALARYTPQDFIALVEKHGIPYHEKTLGQLFCDRSARDILGMLEAECRDAGVSIFLNTKIDEVERARGLRRARRECGVPRLGAGGRHRRPFDSKDRRNIIRLRPGAPVRRLPSANPGPASCRSLLNAEDSSRYCDLAGVSAEVIASCAGQQFREKMLITHRGLSGPAILQISSYWNEHQKNPQPILIDLAPEREVTAAFRDPTTPRNLSALRAELHKFLPHRLADRWLEAHAPTSWTNHALADLEKQTHAWAISPAGTEGYEKAEVTAGGVDTDELSAKTMESRKVPGLFFIGEVVDVTGHLGGFNFQWAWASGAAAGRAL